MHRLSLVSSMADRERRRWLALGVVCLAQLMIVLDTTIVNVALPAIQQDLHFTQGNLTWVVDAFLVTFGSFLLLAGRLGDLFGRKRMFLAGVVIFTAASAMCGLAPDQGWLIAARFIQGIGAAVQASVILAIIVTEFPEAGDRARAMSAYVFVAVAGGSLGLLAGGALTQTLSWNWIFFVNLPIGALTIILGRILVPARSPPRHRRFGRLARLAARHRLADDRHLRDHPGLEPRLGLDPRARLRGHRGRAHGGVPHPRGAHRQPDHAAAHSACAGPRSARASCGASWSPACTRPSSSARSTSSTSSTTARCRPALPTCRGR